MRIFCDLGCYFRIFDQKIAYNFKIASQILMEFYVEMCLNWLYKLNKSGVI